MLVPATVLFVWLALRAKQNLWPQDTAQELPWHSGSADSTAAD
jgi:hypothetical protein